MLASTRYRPIDACRVSGSTNLVSVLTLGNQRLTGVFPKQRNAGLTAGPLELLWCPDSGLLQFIKLPLLNYTNFKGSLLASNCDENLEMDPLKIKYSPRYVYFDECMLLAKSHNLNILNLSPFEWAKNLYESINNDQVDSDMSWEIIEYK